MADTLENPQSQDLVQQGQSLQQSLANNGGLVNAAGENLQCQWRGCGERCATPEALYEHVCERHVGRKSTNNLNLTCAWAQCNTTTVKRDHITSHIRVHVPLKPHKCDFCGKAFKRPQDLKKHVKTHADDSVLPRSPDPTGGARQPQGMVGPAQGGYYQPAMGPQDYAGQHAPQYYQPQHPQGAQHPGYAPMYYPNPPTQTTYHQDFDMRKRLDVLDQFFGDIKRRQIDPVNFQNVSQRLSELHGLQLPTIVQQPASAIPAYQPVSAIGGGFDHNEPIQSYSLPPLGNAKTREDLTSIDRILEQMQATIYENDTNLAANGMQTGMSYTAYSNNQSPPSATLPSTHAHSNLAVHQHHGSVASNGDSNTPGLTPPSSAHSPMTANSAQSNNAMYPTLPTSSSEQIAYAAANATLNMYDSEEHRRQYGGGMLQRAKPAQDAMDVDRNGSATPPAAALNKQAKGKKKGAAKSSVIDPALSGDAGTPSSGRSSGSTSQDHADREQNWIASLRLVEQLRSMIKQRLDSGDYEDGKQADTPMDTDEDHKKDQEQLYPVLRAVSDAA